MMKNKKLKKIFNVLKSSKNKTFFIAGHENPDGDTIGCMIALSSFLKRLKKKPYPYVLKHIPHFYRFLKGIKMIRRIKNHVRRNFDVGILLECPSLKRLGNYIDLKKQVKYLISIDHHPDAEPLGNINLINKTSSSNAEQIFELFRLTNTNLNKMECEAIYTGIVTDTGKFQYSSTTPYTHLVVSELLKRGINHTQINEKIYNRKKLNYLKLLSFALKSMKLHLNDKVAISIIPNNTFTKTKTDDIETEEIVNYGLLLEGVEVSILIREIEKNFYKISFRSKNDFDVSQLAHKFAGGGHKHAAGCRWEGNIKPFIKKLLTEIRFNYSL